MQDFDRLIAAYRSLFKTIPVSILFRSPAEMRRMYEILERCIERGSPLSEAEIAIFRKRRFNLDLKPIGKGSKLPNCVFMTMMDTGPEYVSVRDIFAGQTIVLFAIPGAFNPVSHYVHLPGFLDLHADFMDKNVDMIACTAVNDVFVLDDWANQSQAKDKILFLSDGNGDFARSIGMTLDCTTLGMGMRSKRYAMLVEDMTVAELQIEANARVVEDSSASQLLRRLDLRGKRIA